MIANGSKTLSREALAPGCRRTSRCLAPSVFQEDLQTAGSRPTEWRKSLGTFQEVKSGTFADRVEFIADVDANGVSAS